jgi:hypothetical protein
MKKDDNEFGQNDHNKRNSSRDFGKSSYRNRHTSSYSPPNKRRTSYESPRVYNNRHKDDYYYERDRERERKPHYYDRRESSDIISEESSLHDVRRESRSNVRPSVKRSYNFLICMPKNYFRFIDQNYDKLYRQVYYFKNRSDIKLEILILSNMTSLYLDLTIMYLR